MWVRLKAAKFLEQGGRQRAFQAGDYVEVGKQTALSWIRAGQAELPGEALKREARRAYDLKGCLLLLEKEDKAARQELGNIYPGLAISFRGAFDTSSEADSPGRVCFWNPAQPARLDLFGCAFDWLKRWEFLAPLRSYEELACDVGSEAERRWLAEAVPDLRVPLYEPALCFVRSSEAGRGAWLRFSAYKKEGHEPALALLRALFEAKPLLFALPNHWLDGLAPSRWPL